MDVTSGLTKQQEANQRWYAKMRADPERWAAYLEKARAKYKPHPRRAYNHREWLKANADKVREYKKKAWRKNLEDNRTKQRARYAKDRERILAQMKISRDHRRDEINAQKRAEHAANPEKRRRYQKSHKKANPGAWRLYGIRKTAKANGLLCDLDREWFDVRLAAGICEMSGLPFDFTNGRGPNAPSVDRIDPKGPYTKSNCRLILWWLNRAMLDLGEEYALGVFGAVMERRRQWMRCAA